MALLQSCTVINNTDNCGIYRCCFYAAAYSCCASLCHQYIFTNSGSDHIDRNQLALVDGDFSAADTLGDDIAWTLRALTESAQGRVLAPEEEAKGVTLLSRTPTGTPSLPEATDTPEATAGEDAKADTGEGRCHAGPRHLGQS